MAEKKRGREAENVHSGKARQADQSDNRKRSREKRCVEAKWRKIQERSAQRVGEEEREECEICSLESLKATNINTGRGRLSLLAVFTNDLLILLVMFLCS